MSNQVCAVVVTFNRAPLLRECLGALLRQSSKPDFILVVDNASSDGTPDMLQVMAAENPGLILSERLPSNLGGAGGFSCGLARALELGASWVWMMDDDAEPEPDALQMLMRESPSPSNVYASVPQRDGILAWPVTWELAGTGVFQVVHQVQQLPARCSVRTHPFLGFLIHRDLVQRIGLPDAALFISADDIEYSLRARATGAKILLIRASRISHPVSTARLHKLLGLSIPLISLAPWRRYYDTRNRLLVARRHHGWRFWTQALPGTLARMLLIALYEPNKAKQLKAMAAGLWDGLRGVSGVRHTTWHLGN